MCYYYVSTKSCRVLINSIGDLILDLNERKKLILKAIVDYYIKTAEPVGSSTVAKDIALSPATIRNEMSELEEMGFLEKTHTSSGRIPSSICYRLYVDELMNRDEISLLTGFEKISQLKVRELDTLIREASKLISQLTDYTALAISPNLEKTSIVKFEIISVDSKTFVVVVVTNLGVVKNKIIKAGISISSEDIELLTYVLNQTLTHLPMNNITKERFDIVRSATGENDLILPIAEFLSELILEKSKVYVDGTSNILNFPEYQNPDKAKKLLDFISNQDNLPNTDILDVDGVKITIGPENGIGPMKDTSIIYANYNIGNMGQGIIGIVGPTRMNYSQMSAAILEFAKELNKLIETSFNYDNGGIDDR